MVMLESGKWYKSLEILSREIVSVLAKNFVFLALCTDLENHQTILLTRTCGKLCIIAS